MIHDILPGDDTTAISFRILRPGEESAAAAFVLHVFAEFVAPGYEQEGIDEFSRFVNAEAMERRHKEGDIILLAEHRASIIGLIEMRNGDHIALFFVDRDYQRQGIGRELLMRAVGLSRAPEPGSPRIEVNASPNAVEAYKSFGFTPLSEEQTENGIRFIPMQLLTDQVPGF